MTSLRDQLVNTSGSILDAAHLLRTWVHDNKLKVDHVYDYLRNPGRNYAWYKTIWDSAVMPSHAVIAYFASVNALPTFSNLMSRGMHGPNICNLCGNGEDSTPHLFFSCPYSRMVLAPIKAWINLHHTSHNLQQILWLLKRHFRSDRWRHKLAKVAICATIYCLWGERNERIFKGTSNSHIAIIRKVKFLSAARMLPIHDHRDEEIRIGFMLD